MIKTVAELLRTFANEERQKLDTYKMAHAPTIGAMYEGLSRSILQRALPESLNLKVVEGFVVFGKEISGQIDCMLVSGEGERIPHTDKFKWPIEKVIVVFEIKKTLTSNDLTDSYFHLREVDKLYASYIQSGQARDVLVSLQIPRRIFAQISGVIPPPHSKVEQLSFELEMIYHTLVMEFLSPVRIVVGHHGWKQEVTLREHIYGLLEKRKDTPQGLGVGSFPQLIVGGSFSLVKANGFPYVTKLMDGMWPFLLSSRANPILLLIELIWTRLDYMFGLENLYSNDHDEEQLNPCLLAKAVRKEELCGWEYQYNVVSEKTLASRGEFVAWEPARLSDAQASVFHFLCAGRDVVTTDHDFLELASQDAQTVEEFVLSILETGLVAKDGNRLVLTTMQCDMVVTPEGIFAAENNAGQLTAWVNRAMNRHKRK